MPQPPSPLSPVILSALKVELVEGRRLLREQAARTPPVRGLELTGACSALVDRLVERLHAEALAALSATRDEDPAAQVAVVATGSYGRSELCPRSDVDLAFVVPTSAVASARVRALVDAVLYGLWDLGFEVGHAVRTVEESLVAADDQTVLSALLDARLLGGPVVGREARALVFSELTARLEGSLLAGLRAERLIEEKLAEAARRRERFGSSVYLLEPNVKESEGGLRELHTAQWIARARWRARTVPELVRLGVLSVREGQQLLRAYAFLLRVRAELHLVADRRQDVLGFQHQEPVACSLGYLSADELDVDKKTHGIERFMRAYYYHARTLEHHARLLVERATKHRPPRDPDAARALGDFELLDGALALRHRDQLVEDPAALLRVFRVAEEEGLELHSYTKALIVASRGVIDRARRRDPRVVGELLAMLEQPKSDGASFTELHELGVLRSLMPELSRITARWQRSLYHVYTVDQHSLFTLQALKRLRVGAYADEQRELTRLIADLPRPHVLYLAGLLHDVGKGWPRGDHSRRGARVAETIGRRLEEAGLDSWTREETEDLAWLVLHHLEMSELSQRRDVSDGELVGAFAAEAQSEERLTMLYLLTFADMKSTSPKVWTAWKASLLRELYENARAHLVHSSVPGAVDAAAHVSARRRRAHAELLLEAAARAELGVDAATVDAFCAAMPARYLLSFLPRSMLRHVAMWREVSRHGGLATHLRPLPREDITELTVVCPDRQGLLALLAGALAAHRLQILSAAIFSIELLPPTLSTTSRSRAADAFAEESGVFEVVGGVPALLGGGRAAVDVLYVKDVDGHLLEDPERYRALRAELTALVAGSVAAASKIGARLASSRLSGRPRPTVRTEVLVVPGASRTETVIDVFCQDRIGVLFTIAQVFAEQGLDITLAKISTQGDRVADGFYVTDARTGGRVDDPARLEAVRQALLLAIDPVRPVGPTSTG
jgi:[protein-PII] uridylyltransferase